MVREHENKARDNRILPKSSMLTVVSIQLFTVLTNSSLPLHLSKSEGILNLGQICQHSVAKI